MNLDHISVAACPECGCSDIRKVEKANKHSNGQWNERLKFDCGLELHYSPNYSRVDVESDCGKSLRAVTWRNRRLALAEVMVDALSMEVEGFKDHSPDALKRSLARDLDMYRDELEGK
ncbi:hypothetical protein [Pseudomonas sp. MF7448]|uniref:hypothetical protein n=1 Tax=Pseudomonas sp. MF7448 TaxID=2797537 RepID=UPI00190DDEF1|nr:hypothetical protein [Pseudomonas sp. MF7448]MBK3439308.1 hypothetical protein [Pseudomonas sp. MF7448]